MLKNVGRRCCGWVTAGLAAFLLVIPATERCQAQAGRQRPGEADAIRVGAEAPDFDLVRFECVKPEGEEYGAGDKIRLSWYRGKKPVFVIFSSYT